MASCLPMVGTRVRIILIYFYYMVNNSKCFKLIHIKFFFPGYQRILFYCLLISIFWRNSAEILLYNSILSMASGIQFVTEVSASSLVMQGSSSRIILNVKYSSSSAFISTLWKPTACMALHKQKQKQHLACGT